ncbi:hypothetical protein GGR52DRAFT_261022 [Hypoxylon sp. FL1284]|nr:hypothetical protein GGR52DRAFT_261022 [Hypoxylon sp. FL1284]
MAPPQALMNYPQPSPATSQISRPMTAQSISPMTTRTPTPMAAMVPATFPASRSSTTDANQYNPQSFPYAPQPQTPLQSQPQYFRAARTSSSWCDPNTYTRMQNTAGQAGRGNQLQGIRGSSSVSSTVTPERQTGWTSSPTMVNQQASPPNVFTSQLNPRVTAGTRPRPYQQGNETVSRGLQPSVSPMGPGVMPHRPKQPVLSRATPGPARERAVMPSREMYPTSAPRYTAPNLPPSQPQPSVGLAGAPKRHYSNTAPQEHSSADATPAPKRKKTAVTSSTAENNWSNSSMRSTSLAPSASPMPSTSLTATASSTLTGLPAEPTGLSAEPANNSFGFAADNDSALSNMDFDWSLPSDFSQEQVPQADSAPDPWSGVDSLSEPLPDDFFARFFDDLSDPNSQTG